MSHTYILITLKENDKIVRPIDINKVFYAEIPDIQTHHKLRNYAEKHIMEYLIQILYA